jgi:predicted aconitase
MTLLLSDRDREMATGIDGDAPALAMRILIRIAEAGGAARMIDVTSAHIDSCLYHGQAGLDLPNASPPGAAGWRCRPR